MITELFIKQCEQAKEIQKLCEYKMGDWFYTTIYRRGVHKGFMVISIDYGDNYPGGILPDKHKKDNFVTKGEGWWLPTQEQLQEMIFKSKEINLADWFSIFALEYFYIDDETWETYSLEPREKTKKFHSFNELWLAFIMHELYNKRWTGKDWKTIEATNSPNKKE